MSKRLLIAVAAVAFSAGSGVPLLLPVAARPAAAQSAEGQSVIRGAMDKISGAKSDLVNFAEKDPKGHRVKAVEHLNQALDELSKVLEPDKH